MDRKRQARARAPENDRRVRASKRNAQRAHHAVGFRSFLVPHQYHVSREQATGGRFCRCRGVRGCGGVERESVNPRTEAAMVSVEPRAVAMLSMVE